MNDVKEGDSATVQAATVGAEQTRAIAFAALLTLPLSACLPSEPVPDPNGSFGSSVTAMDHDPNDTFVRTVYVNGRWVGEASGGGGIVLGGISLPNRWRPRLTAVVKWERCDRFDEKHPVPDDQACRWTEKAVPIHQYDEVGRTWLHLLPGDQVLIIPSMLGPGHPDYPGPDLPTKNFFRNTPARDAAQSKDATNEQCRLHAQRCAADADETRPCADLQARRMPVRQHRQRSRSGHAFALPRQRCAVARCSSPGVAGRVRAARAATRAQRHLRQQRYRNGS
jgi:hypothetical protein